MCLGQAHKRAQVKDAGKEYVHSRQATTGDVVSEVKCLGTEELSRRKIAVPTCVSVGTVQKIRS